jgi:hypothetical protein
MLTYPNCCIQVALSVNRATCCFDTSQGRYWRHRVWDSIVYFWRIASTKGHLLGTLTKAARLCCGEISPLQCAGVNRHEVEDARALRERSSDPLGLESCAATARDTAKRRQRIGGVGIQLRKDAIRTPTSL